MRGKALALMLSITLSLSLAGCLEAPLPENDDLDGDQGDPETGTEAKPGPDGPQENGLEGDESADPADAEGEPAGNGTSGENLACHEQERPSAVHPDEQRVATKDGLKCPGHYMILDEGDGETWDAPVWEVGDWWHYEHEGYDGVSTSCIYQSRERVVTDDDEVLGVPVYTLEIETFHCDGEPTGYEARTENRSQESLTLIEDDGFIDHRLVFPLKEGKDWSFVLQGCRDGECTQAETDDVSYNAGGGLLSSGASWDIQWSFSGSKGKVTFEQSYSLNKKNLQEETMWIDSIATPIQTKTLIDSSLDDEGEKDGPLGLP